MALISVPIPDSRYLSRPVLPFPALPPLSAPAAVRHRAAPRSLTRRRRHRRRSSGDSGGFSGVGGGDGPFGGSGWGDGWGESGAPETPDPAFDFVYEVMCWIVFANCALFAVKRILKIMKNKDMLAGRRLGLAQSIF